MLLQRHFTIIAQSTNAPANAPNNYTEKSNEDDLLLMRASSRTLNVLDSMNLTCRPPFSLTSDEKPGVVAMASSLNCKSEAKKRLKYIMFPDDPDTM